MKLCIDPGHGFANRRPGEYDPGAQAFGYNEADIALQWALTLKWVANSKGIGVFLTRSDDRSPDPVATRDDRAEQEQCTHFISIHCNDGGGTGCEAYYRDQADENLAEMALDACVQATGLKSRGCKREGESQHSRLAVFDFDGPATLLEIGFIDSNIDRQKLLSRNVRLDFATRFIEGLLRP